LDKVLILLKEGNTTREQQETSEASVAALNEEAILPNFPLKTKENFQQFDEILQNNENICKCFVSFVNTKTLLFYFSVE